MTQQVSVRYLGCECKNIVRTIKNTLLVNHVGFVRQVRQLHALLLDVEEVGVGVEVVETVGVHLAQLLEVDHSLLHLSGKKYFLY